MRIIDLLQDNSIKLDVKVKSKEDAIDTLVNLMSNTGNISDINKYKQCVLEREKIGTTGIGEQIAIPHAKTDAVKKASLAAMVSKEGVDFDSLDGEPVKLFFLIAAPDTKRMIFKMCK